MAGDTIELMRAISPQSSIYEYQHGLIDDADYSVLYNRKPHPRITKNKINLLVFGKGFYNLLIRVDNTKYFNQETVVPIGFPLGVINNGEQKKRNRVILFALENVQDNPIGLLTKYINQIESLFKQNLMQLEASNYKVVFRNHPRYNPDFQINITSSSVSASKSETILEDLQQVDLLMTLNSTSVFDASLLGIPTILIKTEIKEFSSEETYLKLYKYPLKNLVIESHEDLPNILHFLDNDENYFKSCKEIKNWSHSYYEKFNDKLLLSLLKNKIKNSKYEY